MAGTVGAGSAWAILPGSTGPLSGLRNRSDRIVPIRKKITAAAKSACSSVQSPAIISAAIARNPVAEATPQTIS
jgi:hypothetical protein